MADLYILCEKSSAFNNFKKALGGATGTFNGETFKLGHSHGHLMTLVDPDQQVKDEKRIAELGSWTDMSVMPWDYRDFSWKKTYIKSKNLKTHRMQSTKDDVAHIKAESAGCDAFVIATDNDPSGEGDLLGWEIVNAIGWKKPVYRIRFADETPGQIQKALKNKVDVTDQMKQGEYLKSEARNRFDFLSMQLTRIGTYAARQQGYGVKVMRAGRLKSTIISLVYHQWQKVNQYVKKPYYEVRYHDSEGHIFKRKFDESTDKWRFENEANGKNDLAQYGTDEITNIKRVHKKSAPGPLVDLSKLGSLLAPKGFKSKEILDTYQLMYQDDVVSYPRTEDKKITKDQFEQLLPYVDQIAQVVNIDPSMLTHRTLRSKHEAKHAAHGANRPGTKVPSSLSALSKYDTQAKAKSGCAAAIYETLAKNYLAILGEDYEYDAVTANLKDHPEFETRFNVPVKLNYKLIFDDTKKKKDNDEGSDASNVPSNADPCLYTGSNPKPSKPTRSFVMHFLERNDIGTGATRLSTYAAVTEGKNAELKEKKTLNLSDEGLINAVLFDNTFIASPKVTKQLFDAMDEVGKLKRNPGDILKMLTQIVQHDKPIILENAKQLKEKVGAPKKSMQAAPLKDKVPVRYNGQSYQMSAEWGGHKFTTDEIKQLEAGQKIVIEGVSKAGKPYKVEGHLGKSSYKGHSFVGFQKDRFI